MNNTNRLVNNFTHPIQPNTLSTRKSVDQLFLFIGV
jgi:hypothetical protein